MITVARTSQGMLINTYFVVLKKYYKNSTILLLLQKHNLSLKNQMLEKGIESLQYPLEQTEIFQII